MTASECLAALTAGVLHVSRQRSLTLIQKVRTSCLTATTARTPDCASACAVARLHSRLWLPHHLLVAFGKLTKQTCTHSLCEVVPDRVKQTRLAHGRQRRRPAKQKMCSTQVVNT